MVHPELKNAATIGYVVRAAGRPVPVFPTSAGSLTRMQAPRGTDRVVVEPSHRTRRASLIVRPEPLSRVSLTSRDRRCRRQGRGAADDLRVRRRGVQRCGRRLGHCAQSARVIESWPARPRAATTTAPSSSHTHDGPSPQRHIPLTRRGRMRIRSRSGDFGVSGPRPPLHRSAVDPEVSKFGSTSGDDARPSGGFRSAGRSARRPHRRTRAPTRADVPTAGDYDPQDGVTHDDRWPQAKGRRRPGDGSSGS